MEAFPPVQTCGFAGRLVLNRDVSTRIKVDHLNFTVFYTGLSTLTLCESVYSREEPHLFKRIVRRLSSELPRPDHGCMPQYGRLPQERRARGPLVARAAHPARAAEHELRDRTERRERGRFRARAPKTRVRRTPRAAVRAAWRGGAALRGPPRALDRGLVLQLRGGQAEGLDVDDQVGYRF
jgi:hypothetical protein